MSQTQGYKILSLQTMCHQIQQLNTKIFSFTLQRAFHNKISDLYIYLPKKKIILQQNRFCLSKIRKKFRRDILEEITKKNNNKSASAMTLSITV